MPQECKTYLLINRALQLVSTKLNAHAWCSETTQQINFKVLLVGSEVYSGQFIPQCIGGVQRGSFIYYKHSVGVNERGAEEGKIVSCQHLFSAYDRLLYHSVRLTKGTDLLGNKQL